MGVRAPGKGAVGVGEEINGYTFIFGGKTSHRIVTFILNRVQFIHTSYS